MKFALFIIDFIELIFPNASFSIKPILYLLFITTSLFAQQTPDIINFSREQYQAQNQNWSITQSPNGNIYFGNAGGLLEFNGTQWASYQLPNKPIVRAVACDKRGLIFTGGFSEFGYWEADEYGQLAYQSLSKMVSYELSKKEEIWNIMLSDSLVFFQSFSTIYIYNNREVKVLPPQGNMMFLHNINDRLFFQMIDRGLMELVADGGLRFVENSAFLGDKVVGGIIPLDKDAFLVGTARHGVYKYQNNQFSIWNQTSNELFKTGQLNKAIRLNNGNFGFGTILNGLYIVNPKGEVLQHISQQNGLQNNTILSLFEDNNSNLWLGLDKGIDMVVLNSALTFFKDKTGSIGTVYSGLVMDNYLYVGTNQGVFIKKWAPTNPLLQKENFELVEGTQGQVWELKIFDGQLVCGHNEGTFLIKGKKARKISTITGGWKTIRPPQQPNLLLQGTYTGIIVFKKNRLGEWSFSHRLAEFTEPAQKIIFDNADNLWVAHPNKGLSRLQLDANFQKIIYQRAYGKEDGLISPFKINMEWLNNELLFESSKQFMTFDAATNRFLLKKNPSLNPSYKLKSGQQTDWFEILPNNVTYHGAYSTQNLRLSLVPDYEQIIALDTHRYLFCLDDGFAIFDKRKSHLFEK